MDHTNDNNNKLLVGAVEALSDMRDMKGLFHQHRHGDPLPSTPILEEIISLCRAVLFPGYYGRSALNNVTVKYHIGMEVERLSRCSQDRLRQDCVFHDKTVRDAMATTANMPRPWRRSS